MPDFKVYILTEDQEPRSSQAPADMKTQHYLEEVLENLELPEGAWLFTDKDTQRTLDPDKSLEENGVANGHHLYLWRKEDVIIDKGDTEGATEDGRPSTNYRIIAGVAVLSAIVFGAIGYGIGRSRSVPAPPGITQVDSDALNRAQEEIKLLHAELENTRAELNSRPPVAQPGGPDPAVIQARLDKATKELHAARLRNTSLEKQVPELQGTVQRLEKELQTARHEGIRMLEKCNQAYQDCRGQLDRLKR